MGDKLSLKALNKRITELEMNRRDSYDGKELKGVDMYRDDYKIVGIILEKIREWNKATCGLIMTWLGVLLMCTTFESTGGKLFFALIFCISGLIIALNSDYSKINNAFIEENLLK